MRRLLLVLALLWGIPTLAQTTSVSGTITDAGAQAWAFGSVTFTFRPADSNPTGPYFQNGAPFNISTTVGPIALDGTGSFSGVAVPDNNTITPAQSKFSVKVCPASTTPCVTVALTITGATQSISTAIVPPAVHLDLSTPLLGARAYQDAEVFGAAPGTLYFNLTDNRLHVCLQTGFPPCTWFVLNGGAGTVTSVSGLVPLFTVSNPTTTPTFAQIPVAANTVYGNPTGSTANPVFASLSSFTSTNHNILWVDGVQFSTLASALAACTTSCWIIDTFPETFSSNPFTGFSALAKIDFGAGVWTVNAQISVPSGVSYFTGSGRAGTGATVFRAGGSMPTGTPIFKALGTQGQVFSKFVIDCNSVATSTGMLATDWNENSGIEKMSVLNCPSFSVNVDATGFSSIPAQNYFIRDLEMFPQAAGSGTTIGLHVKGNGGGGPADVRNVTGNGASGHSIRSAVQAENWNEGSFYSIHGEFATNVWENTTSSVSAFILDTITGSTTDTNIVNIAAGSTANSFTLRNVAVNAAGPNSVVDGPRSITLTDTVVGFYEIGGGTVAQQDIYTGSLNIAKHFATGFSLPETLKSVNYTLLKTDGIVNFTTGSSQITINHALTGQVWVVRNSQGAVDMTVVCDSGQINGVASVPLNREQGGIAYADGTNCFFNNDSTSGSGRAILAAPTTCNLSSAILGITSGTTQTVIACAATAPSSGCPCRAYVSWNIAGDGTSSTEQAEGIINDGTSNFAGTSANLNNQITTGFQGLNRSDYSPNTYTNSQAVTFTLSAVSDHTWNIRTATNFLGAPTQVRVTYLSSN